MDQWRRVCVGVSGAVVCLAVAASAFALPTVQDFDNPGTTYTETPLTGYPTVMGGGPTGNFIRIVASGVGNNSNNIAFDRTEVGAAFNRITATFDLSVTSGADGGCFALLNTANYGTIGAGPTGPITGGWEEPALTNSFGLGFDNYYNGGADPNNNHISPYWKGTKLADITPAVAWQNAGFVPVTVDLEFRAKGGFSTIRFGATQVDRRYIGSLAPYENRALFGARTGGVTSNFDVDNVNVTYTAGPLPPPVFAAQFNDFSDVSQFQLRGNAAQVGNRIRLTSSVGGQAGSAFLTDPVLLWPDFTFKAMFSFAVSNPSGDGADGLAFLLQNDSRGAAALGGAGGAIGLTGISPFVAVVFKDYQQPQLQLRTNTGGETAITAVNIANFEDGVARYCWVDYQGWSDILSVYYSNNPTMPLTPTLQYTIDLGAYFGTDTMPFAGFTAATGGEYATHEILAFQFQGMPEPGTLSLLGVGLLALARRRRNRGATR